jgi:hypothetical protein
MYVEYPVITRGWLNSNDLFSLSTITPHLNSMQTKRGRGWANDI